MFRTSARVALALLPLLATAAGADVTLKQKTTTGGMGGMGGSAVTSTTVISGDRSRTDEDMSRGGQSFHTTRITRLDQGVIWTLHDDRKEYSEQSIADLRKIAAAADSALASDSSKVAVQLTGKTDTVNGFACEEAVLTTTGVLPPGAPMEGAIALTMDVWMSKAVPGGDEMRAFGKAFADKAGMDLNAQRMGRMARMFGGSIERVQHELAKLDGVPVSMSTKVEIKTADGDASGGMGPITITTEVLGASTDKSTASFELPKDYKKVEERGFGGMGGGRGPGGPRGGARRPGDAH